MIDVYINYLQYAVLAFIIVYFIKYKGGYYPELIRALIKTLISKLPDTKNIPMQNRDIVVSIIDGRQSNKNVISTDLYSLRHWFNFIFECSFCLSFWVYLALTKGVLIVLFFAIIQSLMILALLLYNSKRIFLTIVILGMLAYFLYTYVSTDFVIALLFAIIGQEFLFKNKVDRWQSELE